LSIPFSLASSLSHDAVFSFIQYNLSGSNTVDGGDGKVGAVVGATVGDGVGAKVGGIVTGAKVGSGVGAFVGGIVTGEDVGDRKSVV